MIETLKKFKYLIIIVVVLVIAFIAYTIYTDGQPATDSTSLQKTTVTGSNTSTVIPSTPASAIPNEELAQSFVNQLLAIKNINLKIAFFADPVFVGLVDNHKGIDPQPIGRPNPFAPIGKDTGAATNNYQDINGEVIISTTGLPTTIGSESSIGTSGSSGSAVSSGTSGRTASTTRSSGTQSSSTKRSTTTTGTR